jgi:hypothetical protein
MKCPFCCKPLEDGACVCCWCDAYIAMMGTGLGERLEALFAAVIFPAIGAMIVALILNSYYKMPIVPVAGALFIGMEVLLVPRVFRMPGRHPEWVRQHRR